jgi:hypothetical protein
LITLDQEEKKAKLSLIAPRILVGLQKPESSDPLHHKSKWRPEYGAYMIEGEERKRRSEVGPLGIEGG